MIGYTSAARNYRLGSSLTIGNLSERPARQVEILWLALLLMRRLKLISALIIIFAAELRPGCLAVGVINVCLIGGAAGNKQAYN
jgi:hypothetical protein